MDRKSMRAGVALAGSAYAIWGLFPAFFKLLRGEDPLRVLAHRGLWAGALAALLVLALRRAELRAFWASPDRRRALATLGLTAALLASNWGVYIYTVKSGQVMQASLGYFICPLVTAALGVAFAGERPGRTQWLALGLAAFGVLQLALRAPSVPWLALYLAVSFASYGMLRKRLSLDPLLASSLEALLMLPLSLGYLLLGRAEPVVELDATGALLAASGVVTAVPLMLFAAGAKRLPYATLGLLQYVTPTLNLLLAVFAYGEVLGRAELVAFGLIWAALLVSSLEAGWRALAARRERGLARQRSVSGSMPYFLSRR
jgi:chloramphenicol-sensitive protein RarD